MMKTAIQPASDVKLFVFLLIMSVNIFFISLLTFCIWNQVINSARQKWKTDQPAVSVTGQDKKRSFFIQIKKNVGTVRKNERCLQCIDFPFFPFWNFQECYSLVVIFPDTIEKKRFAVDDRSCKVSIQHPDCPSAGFP